MTETSLIVIAIIAVAVGWILKAIDFVCTEWAIAYTIYVAIIAVAYCLLF